MFCSCPYCARSCQNSGRRALQFRGLCQWCPAGRFLYSSRWAWSWALLVWPDWAALCRWCRASGRSCAGFSTPAGTSWARRFWRFVWLFWWPRDSCRTSSSRTRRARWSDTAWCPPRRCDAAESGSLCRRFRRGEAVASYVARLLRRVAGWTAWDACGARGGLCCEVRWVRWAVCGSRAACTGSLLRRSLFRRCRFLFWKFRRREKIHEKSWKNVYFN